MRKIIASELVSLDGVMEAPDKWHLPYFNDEMGEAIGAAMANADAMIFGRVTYKEFAAFWPNQSGDDQEFADYMNKTPKYVVSTTLQEPLEWQNSTLIKGNNLAEEIARIKEQPGKDITVSGSGALVRSLVAEEMLDELRLMLHPIIVGSVCLRKGVKGRGWSSFIRRPSQLASSTSPTSWRRAEAIRGLGICLTRKERSSCGNSARSLMPERDVMS